MVLRLALRSLLAAVLIARSAAHSWIDCIDHSYDVVYTNSDRWALTGTKGNGVCEGYAYGFPGRGVSTIGTDFTYKLLPADIKRDAPVCQYKAKNADYTGWRKAIVAKPGDKLYFAYFSNGHVVRDKAGRGTTHGVYWDGRPDVELEKPSQLTKDKLIDKIMDFDDGNCGETYFAGGTTLSGRAGDFKPCVGTFTIPSGTKSGTYPMVWYWTFFKPEDFATDFHTFEGAGGAAYSSCFNVIVEAGEGGAANASDDKKTNAKVVEPKVEVESPTIIKVDGVEQPIVNPQSPHSDVKADVVTDKKEPVTTGKDVAAVQPIDQKQATTGGKDVVAVQATDKKQVTQNGKDADAVQGAVKSPKIEAADAGKPAVESQTSPNMKPAKDVKCRVDAEANVPPPPAADADHNVKAPDAMTEPQTPSANETQTPSANEPQTPAPAAATGTSAPVPLAGTTYIGVGGKGTYGKVTDMTCPDNRPSSDHCVQTPVNVDGPLAPFDEDLTLALRGPLEIDDIAVFTKGDAAQDGSWTKVSSYSHKQANATQNMVFLNNKGDPAKSGEFSMCHGNSQSFASGDGKTAAPAACAFNGVLADGVEVNVMSATSCATSGKSGFARGVAYEGWSGNYKIFMVKAQMPHAAGGKDLPAIWLLNGQIVRTAEYGCNCRGMGDKGPYKGGCGELDVAEIISENKDKLVSQIYSFKGSKGTSPTMARPSDERVVFVVIFSTSSGASQESSAKLGTVQILMMRPEDVDMTKAPTAQCVKEWLAYRNGKLVDFDI